MEDAEEEAGLGEEAGPEGTPAAGGRRAKKAKAKAKRAAKGKAKAKSKAKSKSKGKKHACEEDDGEDEDGSFRFRCVFCQRFKASISSTSTFVFRRRQRTPWMRTRTCDFLISLHSYGSDDPTSRHHRELCRGLSVEFQAL